MGDKNKDNEVGGPNGHVIVDADTDEYREYEQCGFQIGCGSCKSRRYICKGLSCCNTAKGALFFLSCVALFQGFVMNGLINVVISTLERRFSLSSTETGLIASTYDIGTCAALLFVTYVGGRGHKPLWLGWGTFIMGIGSIVFALPHFVAPSYVIQNSVSCQNISSAACGEENLRVYRGFFIASQLLHGIGATPLYTLALTYLDENVKQVHSSIYHGIFYALSLVGPGLGYLLGGQFLNLYTNPGETVNISNDDVLWIGNWWMGFLIGGIAFFVLSIPLLLYPRQLPGTDKHRIGRGNEMQQISDAQEISENDDFGKSIKDFPRCVLIFFKNPAVLFLTLAGAMDNGLISGIATFGPKHYESMFTLTASNAAFIFGLLAIVSSAIGQIGGGLIVAKFNLTVRRMLIMCIVCSTISFGCLLIFLMKCPNMDIAGTTVPYNGEPTANCLSPSSECSTDYYDPVCGADELTYLSYCDAGCVQDNSTHFSNCSRVLTASSITSIGSATAISGKCTQGACPNKEIFGVVVALGVLFVFLTAQPALQASLRAVPFNQRSFAIGIQWLILRLLGSIPVPNILGKVLDLSCLMWGDQCGVRGACNVYSNESMSRNMTTVISIAKGLSLIFFIIALKFYKPVTSTESDDTALESSSKVDDGGSKTQYESTGKFKSLPEDTHHDTGHDNPNFN